MKTAKPNPIVNTDAKKAAVKPREDIETDFPISEKDEVKKAEQKLQQAQKKRG